MDHPPLADGRGSAFRCDSQGYVRHWAVAGPQRTKYVGPAGSDGEMRKCAQDRALATPSWDAGIGQPGPFGDPWRFYSPGWNVFVEDSGFYHKLEVLDLAAATEIHSQEAQSVSARLWAIGLVDLWVNGRHVARLDVPKYMYPSCQSVTLPFDAGVNTVWARVQALGVRDTRMLFGLQVLDRAEALSITVPGPPAATAELVAAEQWLSSVKVVGTETLEATAPPTAPVSVCTHSGARPWPHTERVFPFGGEASFEIDVRVDVAGQSLERRLEVPKALPRPEPTGSPNTTEHHLAYARQCLSRPSHASHSVDAVLARHVAGCPDPDADAHALDSVLTFVQERNDCADFALAGLLRLHCLSALSAALAEAVRRTALGFRYWPDEAGSDAMCFGSENHRLLFHGCQLIAGQLFPTQTFAASGRSGSAQAEIAAARCREWLTEVDGRKGFREFLSSTYMPITLAALMNLVDFAHDADIAARARGWVDKILADLATHSFDGVTVAPQGRVYRGVLYPATSSAQGLLYYAAPRAEPAYTGWSLFMASSPSYEPPPQIPELMRRSAHLRYEEAGAAICLGKTEGYMLNSVQIPAGEGTFDHTGRLLPGRPGYQQHLWHATLGRDCHIFVNHPGTSFDLTMSRPGYWYGNGVLPRLEQREGMVLEVFDIPAEHPVHFTHAHWPSDVLDREALREHWAFGAHRQGQVGLWCSQPLQRRDQVLTGRELLAWGRHVAWLCVCRNADESFEHFMDQCVKIDPVLANGRLQLNGL